MIHGDYGRFLDETGLDSVTDYVCYKGLYSAINSRNLFEIEHSLTRLFGAEPWAVCRGRRLLNFADNHDVTRLYTMLNDKRDVYAAYTILFAMPGIPCVYYGSEYRAEGDKRAGDEALRPAWADIDTSDRTLYDFIARLAAIRRAEPGLRGTSYRKLFLTNTALAFGRTTSSPRSTSRRSRCTSISAGASASSTAGRTAARCRANRPICSNCRNRRRPERRKVPC